MHPTKFRFIWQNGFRGEDFLEIIQSELSQMNRNLVGRIYGRFSIRIANFVLIINKHGRHKQLLFLIGQFSYQVSYHLAK
jgi:hypothetical protein